MTVPKTHMIAVAMIALFFSLIQSAWSGENRVVYSKKGKFEDIRDDVALAITGRGMVINNIAHVGEMLERTGKDLGATRDIYLKADVFEFCSAVLSRKMMEADPDNIVYCPYTISVYVLPESPDVVKVAYRKPPTAVTAESAKALDAVENLLSGIVQEALQIHADNSTR